MATLYCDYEGGNDLYGGDSFALTATGTDGVTNGTSAFTAASGSFTSALIGRYISVCNGAALLGTYTISAVPSGTSLTLAQIPGGTALSGLTSGSGRTWNIGGRWQTITTGASAARIQAGDVIRLMASPDATSLGQTASWTNLSKTVTLTSAVTQTVDDGEAAWTASANVTATADTTQFKEGTKSAKISLGGSFTTGLTAYKAFSSTDFSGKQQLSFWIRNSVAITAGQYSLRLCSDAAGTTTVNTFNIPAIPSVNAWVVLTIDLASNLGSAIQSIALYRDSGSGVVDIFLDIVIACKASSLADALTLTSLVGKNTTGEGWWGIQSIKGTTIILDAYNSILANASSANLRGYAGNTESVTIYKRETIKGAMGTTSASVFAQVNDSGAEANHIVFSGGWDRTNMSSQTGYTWFDGQNGLGDGIQSSNLTFSKFEYIGLTRYTTALDLTASNVNSSYRHIVNNFYACNCSNAGVNTVQGRVNHCEFANIISVSCGNVGIGLGSIRSASNLTAVGCQNHGIFIQASDDSCTVDSATARNCGNGVTCLGGGLMRSLTTFDNVTAVAAVSSGSGFGGLKIVNFFPTRETGVLPGLGGVGLFSNERVTVLKWNGDATDTRIWADQGQIQSENTVVHTAGGKSWKVSPTSANASTYYPLWFKLTPIAVGANALVTVTAWLRRTNTGLTGMLVVRGGQLAGVASDVTATMSAAADTWQQVSLTFTPTESGLIEVEAWAYGGTTFSLYVDDVEVTQA